MDGFYSDMDTTTFRYDNTMIYSTNFEGTQQGFADNNAVLHEGHQNNQNYEVTFSARGVIQQSLQQDTVETRNAMFYPLPDYLLDIPAHEDPKCGVDFEIKTEEEPLPSSLNLQALNFKYTNETFRVVSTCGLQFRISYLLRQHLFSELTKYCVILWNAAEKLKNTKRKYRLVIKALKLIIYNISRCGLRSLILCLNIFIKEMRNNVFPTYKMKFKEILNICLNILRAIEKRNFKKILKKKTIQHKGNNFSYPKVPRNTKPIFKGVIISPILREEMLNLRDDFKFVLNSVAYESFTLNCYSKKYNADFLPFIAVEIPDIYPFKSPSINYLKFIQLYTQSRLLTRIIHKFINNIRKLPKRHSLTEILFCWRIAYGMLLNSRRQRKKCDLELILSNKICYYGHF